jgi:hypothetical protein
MDQKVLLFRTGVDELLVGYGVAVSVLDPFLHVCHRIFPLGINLNYEINQRSVGLPGRKIPGISSAGVF